MCWYKEIGPEAERKSKFRPSPQKDITEWPSNCLEAEKRGPKIKYIPRIESFYDR